MCIVKSIVIPIQLMETKSNSMTEHLNIGLQLAMTMLYNICIVLSRVQKYVFYKTVKTSTTYQMYKTVGYTKTEHWTYFA